MWPQSRFTPAVRILQSLVQALSVERGFLWYKPDKHAVLQTDLFTFLQLLATVTYVDSAPTDGMYACLSPQTRQGSWAFVTKPAITGPRPLSGQRVRSKTTAARPEKVAHWGVQQRFGRHLEAGGSPAQLHQSRPVAAPASDTALLPAASDSSQGSCRGNVDRFRHVEGSHDVGCEVDAPCIFRYWKTRASLRLRRGLSEILEGLGSEHDQARPVGQRSPQPPLPQWRLHCWQGRSRDPGAGCSMIGSGKASATCWRVATDSGSPEGAAQTRTGKISVPNSAKSKL